MPAMTYRPKNANWLTPYLTVADAEKSLKFYQRAFGFKAGNTMPGPDGRIAHAEMTYRTKIVIMFAPENAWGSTCRTPRNSGVEPSLNLYVYVRDVDKLAKRAKRAKAEVLSEPETMFWGDRIARIRDQDGYLWTFATKVGELDPSKVPHH